MIPKFKLRELILMTLPIVLLGGVGWWISKGGSLLALRGVPADIYTGQPRLNNGQVELVPVSSWNVSQGFVWGAKTVLWQKGQLPIDPKVHRQAYVIGSMMGKVVYLRDGVWKNAPNPSSDSLVRTEDGEEQPFGNFAVSRAVSFQVKLNGVPRDAEEIRLRGHFRYENVYPGSGCRGIEPGPNWRIYPQVCYYTTSSTFDIPIKTRGGSWPQPIVSRMPNLQFLGAYCLYTPSMYSVSLHVRDPAGVLAAHNRGDMAVQNFSLQDKNGKEVMLYETLGSSAPRRYKPLSLSFVSRGVLNPAMPANEYVAVIDGEPKNGWPSVEGPMHLHAQISDFTSWPTTVDAQMNLKNGQWRDIGAKTTPVP